MTKPGKQGLSRRQLLGGALTAGGLSMTGAGFIAATNPAHAAVAAGQTADNIYLPTTARIMFSGHSLVDAIFSGSGDPRQTLTRLLPDANKIWRMATIPGSTMEVRWNWRNGGNDRGEFPTPPPPPIDWNDPYGRATIPGLDLPEFDAVLMTEGGPFAMPLNPDRFNEGWNYSADYLDRWWLMAQEAGIAPGNFVFWTIWPGTDFVKGPEHAPDLPDFLAYLRQYGQVAEEWCRKRKIRIIPGHRIWEELYTRFHDGRLPGVLTDIMADTIHANFLGSIFTAVGCYRHLFGEMPDTARIQALLRQEKGHAITVQHVLEVVEATLDYAQGPGLDLQVGSYVPPAPFWDAAQPPAAQGFTTIGSYVPGEPVGPGNAIWKAVPQSPQTLFAILELDLRDGDALSFLATFQSSARRPLDDDQFGLTLHADGGNSFIALRDGGEWTMMNRPKPWTGTPSILLCIAATKEGMTIRDLKQPGWMSALHPRGTRAAPSDRFGVNLAYADGAPTAGQGNFAIPRGVFYAEWPTDRLERLRLIAHFCDGAVP